MIKRAGVSYVMRSLQIGAEDKLAPLAQGFLHVEAEGFHEFVFVIKHGKVIVADQLIFPAQSTGGENAGNGHLVEIRLDKAALAVGLLIGETVHDGLGKMAGVDTDTTVFIAFAVDEVAFVAFRNEVVVLDFVGPHAVILNTDHVSVLPGQPFKEAFFNSLSETVDADCYYPHTCSLIRFVCMIPVLRVN